MILLEIWLSANKSPMFIRWLYSVDRYCCLICILHLSSLVELSVHLTVHSCLITSASQCEGKNASANRGYTGTFTIISNSTNCSLRKCWLMLSILEEFISLPAAQTSYEMECILYDLLHALLCSIPHYHW